MIGVSIDPGIRRLGFAVWEGSVLVGAGLSRADQDHATLAQRADMHARQILNVTTRTHTALRAAFSDYAYVVVESMEAGGDRVPPQDLIEVEAVGCLTAAWVSPTVFMSPPSVWKSSVPKDVHHERNRTVLTERERAILDAVLADCPKGNRKEVLDAVGIGLYYHKRTAKSGGARV